MKVTIKAGAPWATIWDGELSVVPRVGEEIHVGEHFGVVHQVAHMIDDDEVVIRIK